ncbi:MAG: anti-sigma factor [Verrucomicrobiia bacterium]
MTEKQIDLLIQYLLDADSLDDRQRRALEASLRHDPALAQEARTLADTLAALGHALPPVSPPEDLRAKVLTDSARLAQPSPEPPTQRRPTPTRWLVLIAGILILLGLGIFMTPHPESRETPVTVDRRPDPVPMEAQNDDYAGAAAQVLWDATSRSGRFQAEHLPALPTDQVYQVWILDPGKPQPIPAGLMPHPVSGPASVTFGTDEALTAPVRIALSIEPSGGSPAPTGPVVLVSAETGG